MSLKDISNFFGTLFHCSLLTPLKLMLILSIMHLRFWTMVLSPCLMVLYHIINNMKQISLYSSIARDLLIGVVTFSWNMPPASQWRENQAILWYACAATTNLYSKVLILLMNATSEASSLYKLILSLLWERNKSFATPVKSGYQMLFFWGEKTHITFLFRFWTTN